MLPIRSSALAPFRLALGLLMLVLLPACMTTRVMTQEDSQAFANDPTTDTIVTGYWWGIGKQPVVRPACDPGYNHLNGVTVRTHFGHYLLATVTLGIVQKKEVRWYCARCVPNPPCSADSTFNP